MLTASAQKFSASLLTTTGFVFFLPPLLFCIFSVKRFSQQRENHKLLQHYSPALRPICVFTNVRMAQSKKVIDFPGWDFHRGS